MPMKYQHLRKAGEVRNMYAAEIVWTNNEYDSGKAKVVKKLMSNVKIYQTEKEATEFVDKFYESCQGVKSVTFRIGKVYKIMLR